jgi:TP901 family phage tail tape measure protein
MADNRLRYYITGNATGLNKALTSASQRVQGFGKKIQGIGAGLQKFSAITALAGGAAVKMAMDFDKNLGKIEALVGVSGSALDELAEASKRVAKQTGISSAETSEAMFFITSAGLRGADAIQVLESASRASASGLGDVATIADLATSAMNAYGVENLDASAATDVLTAAVREGKLEASALAGSMGSVIPLASALEVSFDEVGAAMAAMSRTGTDAASGATQLSAILSSLTKVTPAARDNFRLMGLDVDELRNQLKEEGGLINVLFQLKDGIDGNTQAASDIFPNLRALRGVLDLLGKGANTTKDIFNELSKSQGATQKAFEVTEKRASFQLQKSLNNVKESFKEVGEEILVRMLPAFTKALEFVRNIFNAFNNLDGGIQKAILSFGALVVVGPTIISLFGTLISLVGTLLTPIGLLAAALAGVAYIIYKNWGEVAPVLVGLYNQFVDLYNSSLTLRTVIAGVGVAFKTVFIGIKTAVFEVVNVFSTLWKLIKEFSEKGVKGSFLDILNEGFEDAKQIANDGADEIGEAFDDGIEQAFGSRLEKKTVEQLNGSLSNAFNTVKKKFGDFTSFFAGGTGVPTTEPTTTTEPPTTVVDDEEEDKYEKTTEKVSKLKTMFDMLKGSADAVGEGIKGAFLGAFDAMMQGENVFKALGQMLLDLIKKFVAAALAAFVLSTLVKAIFPGAGGGGGAFEGLKDFKSLFGSFAGIEMAKGGIVSTPTLATVGEYAGARQNPEVIAPLDKLKNLIGENGGGNNIQVGGQFTLKGQDLVVALQRADRNRNRIK